MSVALLFLACVTWSTRQAFGSRPETTGLTNESRNMGRGDLSSSFRVLGKYHQPFLARRRDIAPLASPRSWNACFHSSTIRETNTCDVGELVRSS